MNIEMCSTFSAIENINNIIENAAKSDPLFKRGMLSLELSYIACSMAVNYKNIIMFFLSFTFTVNLLA